MTRKQHFRAAAALALLLLSAFLVGRQTGTQNPTAAEARAAATNASVSTTATPVASTITVVAPSSAVAAKVTMPAAEPKLAPASVRQVLPSVQYQVSDWSKFTPEKLTVEPVPGCPVEFKLDHVEQVAGRTVWVGRNEDIPGASYVSVADTDSYTSSVVVPGASEYRVRVSGESVTVSELSEGICAETVEANASAALAAQTPVAAADASAVNTVDVLVFYNGEVVATEKTFLGAQTDAEVKAAVETESILDLTQSNAYLENSGVNNLRWRFVGAEVAPAALTPATFEAAHGQTLETDLRAFAANSEVTAKMESYGADQAILWVATNRSDFATVAALAQCPGNYVALYYKYYDSTFTAHELAHNFGCKHDRATDGIADSDANYNYGYRGSYAGQGYGTIMSYGANLLPYFSNPSMTVSSATVVAGTNDQITIGIAAGQTGAADNARWLREKAASMAATRAPDTAPAITSQPAGATITAGQILSVSVTATGGHLTYQWSKDGVTIPGATSATYSKSATTTADSGSYTVTVSNPVGNVTSNSAAVTVKAASSNTGGNNSGGSSGGGGGALSGWFVVALLALLGRKAMGRPARAA
jgi:hypothetical protein